MKRLFKRTIPKMPKTEIPKCKVSLEEIKDDVWIDLTNGKAHKILTVRIGFSDKIFKDEYEVIKALDKAVPMKPKSVNYCNNCNKHLYNQDYIDRIDYCKHCGQKLDWSDV